MAGEEGGDEGCCREVKKKEDWRRVNVTVRAPREAARFGSGKGKKRKEEGGGVEKKRSREEDFHFFPLARSKELLRACLPLICFPHSRRTSIFFSFHACDCSRPARLHALP